MVLRGIKTGFLRGTRLRQDPATNSHRLTLPGQGPNYETALYEGWVYAIVSAAGAATGRKGF